MSRIGQKPLTIPTGVTCTITSEEVRIKGPKGELVTRLHPHVTVTQDAEGVHVTVKQPDLKDDRALWGLFGSLLDNMVTGVTQGFTRQLELNGVGYRVAAQGKGLKFELGYSHPIEFPLPAGVTATVEKNVITLSSIDKQLVGQVAADMRKLRKPEPYKGKGVKYVEEVIRRKAGKAAKAA